ncbi:cytochrome P450 9e2-like isoform X2 [Photinus pyralis]|uniref:cytochrome P450 9e2-like isoform X2 n=1 Tax=Photinus pyralis TaxID=7054 RepID=UPI001267421F|nr:cytochrome P450 9e2-like isoform X2 [Photinus pyralis]
MLLRLVIFITHNLLEMWFTLFVGSLIFLLYQLWLKPLRHWEKQNVQYVEPWPLFGNLFPVIMGKQSTAERLQELYNSFGDERCIGIHLFTRPQLMLKSLSLVQLIGAKDVSYFESNAHKWQDLGGIFGVSSMRSMFRSVSDHASNFVRQLPAEEIDCQDVFPRLATDLLASVTLGVVNVLVDETNELFAATRNLLTDCSIFTNLKELLRLEPRLDFLGDVIKKQISERESVAANMLEMLLQLRDGKELEPHKGCNCMVVLSDEEIVNCAKALLLEGIQTTSSLMCAISCELAINTNEQQKLLREIDDTLQGCNGAITYDKLVDMKYLDMVVSESLRKWPPKDTLKKICGSDYTVRTEEGDIAVVLEKGSSVIIPVYAIHRDPKYFSCPGKFDPERFSDENKCNIVPFSYMPFGVGRESCIAPRLALLVTKIVFFHLLSQFELRVVDKTTMPMMYMNPFSKSREHCHIGLKKRK